jgi:hypothetical protein
MSRTTQLSHRTTWLGALTACLAISCGTSETSPGATGGRDASGGQTAMRN